MKRLIKGTDDILYYPDGSLRLRKDFLVTGKTTLFDKLMFTQTDGNEYIDSLADGYMDYGATTAHRFGDGTNQTVIKADGEINLEGTARVLNAYWIDAGAIRAPGAKPATQVDWGIGIAWEFSDATDDTLIFKLPRLFRLVGHQGLLKR